MSKPKLSMKSDNTDPGEKKSSTKKNLVMEGLLALALYYPHIGLANYGKVVMRRDYLTMDQARIISGCGSGHEPAFSGFVGKGMLTASVQGEIFKSPSSADVFTTIRELSIRGGSNLLVIIQNEAGIAMNFGLAVERAKNEGIDTRVLLIKDDVDRNVERKRGLSGIILVMKIAGAMAEQGMHASEIYEQCKDISKHIYSLISYIKNCVLTYEGNCSCTTSNGESYTTPISKCQQANLEEIWDKFMHEMKQTDLRQAIGESSSPVVVLINNLGHATRLEEQLCVNFVMRKLYEMRVTVARLYCGKYLTSIQASGFCISVLTHTTTKIYEYLDAPTNAPSWIPASFAMLRPEQGIKLVPKSKAIPLISNQNRGAKLPQTEANIIQMVVQFACEAIISCERQLNTMDSESGDGDTGFSMTRGAKALKKYVSKASSTCYPYTMFTDFSKIVEQAMGGTLGALYSIFFEAGSKPFNEFKETDPVSTIDWVNSLIVANSALTKYTDSKVGDNTILDPLNACAITMQATIINGALGIDALASGVTAAEEAARMKKPGRKQPDPGAYAVGLWIRAIYEGIKLKT